MSKLNDEQTLALCELDTNWTLGLGLKRLLRSKITQLIDPEVTFIYVLKRRIRAVHFKGTFNVNT